jgi:hypothetical protein
MNGNWTESNEKLVKLHEDDPRAFGVYLNHVYTGQLPTMNGKFDVDPLPDQGLGAMYKEFRELAKVYVLSERLQDRVAKNAVVLAIFGMTQHETATGVWFVPHAETVATVYAGTTENNLARQLLVDIWTNAKTSVVSDGYEILPKEFLRDLAIALAQDGKQRSIAARKSDGSKYLEKEVAENAKSKEGSNSK